MFKKLYLVLILGSALACKAAPDKLPVRKPMIKVSGSTDIQPDEKQQVVCKTVTQLITGYNYKKVPLNDSISALIYTKYIKLMDENHNYFLASDITDFDKYKTVLDDDLKDGNLNDAFYMFNVYQKRYIERVKYSLAQIDKEYDFTKNRNFHI